MMRGSNNSEMVEMTVIAQIPDLQDGDEVFISAFDRRLSLKASGTPVPHVPDTFIFRLTIPAFASFQFHLYTRLHPSPTDTEPLPVDRDLGPLSMSPEVVEADPHPEEEASNRSQVRINRAEWYGHVVVATPDWKTVFVSWGDVFSNWMKSPEACGPLLLPLLMMVRCQKDQPKHRLKLRLLKLRSYDQDEDGEGERDEDRVAGGGGAREISSSEKEFPLGSGCFWLRGPKEIVKNPSKFCLQVTDQTKRKSVHHQLHVTWSELPVGESDFKPCVVCCALLPNAGPVPVPRLSTRATPHSVNDLATEQSSSESHTTLASGMRVSAAHIQCLDF